MADHVISHRKLRRKRGGVWSFLLRRFGALAVTFAALAGATWLAPYAIRPAPPLIASTLAEPRTPPEMPPPAGTEVTLLITADEPAPQARRPRRARRSVPLDANPGDMGEDFEVLSAGELEAISQSPN